MKDKEKQNVFEDIKLGLEQATEYEKQIEEMANILCESKEHNCNGEDCKCLKQATDLFNKGARILSEDSVVLSQENYDKLCHLAYFGYDDYYAKGSKETAGAIYEQLQGHGTTYVKKWIKKNYGEEIGE